MGTNTNEWDNIHPTLGLPLVAVMSHKTFTSPTLIGHSCRHSGKNCWTWSSSDGVRACRRHNADCDDCAEHDSFCGSPRVEFEKEPSRPMSFTIHAESSEPLAVRIHVIEIGRNSWGSE